MVEVSNSALMWFFTFVLLVGFVLTYMNLNGEVVFYNRYEGLVVSAIGLLASIFVGVRSSRQGLEGFKSLYRL